MHKIYGTTARAIKRVPFAERGIRVGWRLVPGPLKRTLRRTRHRLVMRSPTSMLSRFVTPSVQNRLLGDPHVVEQLLRSERLHEILDHRPASAGKDVDWVAHVALNDPAAVVDALARLGEEHPHVRIAIDRLAREPVLSEEQIVDVFLGIDEFIRREYWMHPRVRDAFLDFLCREQAGADTRDGLLERLDATDRRARIRIAVGDGAAQSVLSGPGDDLVTTVQPPVVADILMGLDTTSLAQLWEIEAFRSSFVENLLDEADLFRFRTLLNTQRFSDPVVRQAMFDVLAGAQPLQLKSDDGETIILPSADLGFAKAYWADRTEQLAHLDTFLRLRSSVGATRPSCFVDVGANLATHTIHALRSGSFDSAVTIEPDPRLVPILRANLALNGFDAVTSVVQAAAGDRTGEVPFWSSDVNWGDNRLSSGDGEEWREIVVPLRTVADVLMELGIAATAVGALWIDVQGHEADVLNGARAIIDAGCDIVVEFWPAVLAKEGRLESTLDTLASISSEWIDLETGRAVDHAGLLAMRDAGLEEGETWYADLALVHGINEGRS